MKINFLDSELWYGGIVKLGLKMPLDKESECVFDFVNCDDGTIADQASPLFFSNKGRYIYSNSPCIFKFGKGVIDVSCEVEVGDGFETLKSAQLSFAKKHFKLDGKIPNKLFMEKPQFNTWIELMYNQNQKDILEYATTLRESGFDGGIFMIDEGWAPDYGDFDFDRRKFDSPIEMVEKLHQMGFKVLLWITPYISPDGYCYREIKDRGFFVKDKNGALAIRQWWNGFSLILDLTNPDCRKWFHSKLHGIMDKYGIDGFKFDGGGSGMYEDDDKIFVPSKKLECSKAFDKFASEYEYNELRAVYDCGGEPIVCRLHDKSPKWTEDGLEGLDSLIPDMLLQGLLGYYCGCPDMVGGGQFTAFKSGEPVNEELYLRWLEVSVLCPMMQFSINPKRILSLETFKKVKSITKIHEKYAPLIVSLMKNAFSNGEPPLRLMEYEFPNCGYGKIIDQFMLGDSVLVAPIVKEGEKHRIVHIPNGCWKRENGEVFEGNSICDISCDFDELIILKKID